MAAHARFAPSAAHRWLKCTASIKEEDGAHSPSNIYSAEGTLAHDLAAGCLKDQAHPSRHLGERHTVDGFTFTVRQDMVDHIVNYMRLVLEYAEGGQLLVEQRVEFSEYVGVDDQFGTSDVVIIHPKRITIIDFKYGLSPVDAFTILDDGVTEMNPQMALYALGCLYEFGMLGDFEEVTMVICQPRVGENGHVSEFYCSVPVLEAFGAKARLAAEEALGPNPVYAPSEKVCGWCTKQDTCAARRGALFGDMVGTEPATPADFDDLGPRAMAVLESHADDAEWLARAMGAVGAVEDWCKAVRATIERKMLAGEEVPGYKLVNGRQGPRKWANEQEVEKLFKSWRYKKDVMYDLSLISPTTAEKVMKADQRRWAKLQPHITRSPAGVSVAAITDKREPVTGLIAGPEDFV